MSTVEEEDPSQHKMLANLDEIRRKVVTGEVVGFVLVAHTHDQHALTRVAGEPLPSNAILVLQEIAEEARHVFLNYNDAPDDGRPGLSTVTNEDGAEGGSGGGGDDEGPRAA